MKFADKLQRLRRRKGYTQEKLAEILNVSRQAVAKWEAGAACPDILNLVKISHVLNVTVDYLVKDQLCEMIISDKSGSDRAELIAFRLEAARKTYAGFANEVESTRIDSHDYRYERGRYVYHDTYVGSEQFAGQEVIWENNCAVYAMNYTGRVLADVFSGDFLKEALRAATKNMPYRGPEFYQAGEYTYRCRVTGDLAWFQGEEEICCGSEKVYECCFHGGMMR